MIFLTNNKMQRSAKKKTLYIDCNYTILFSAFSYVFYADYIHDITLRILALRVSPVANSQHTDKVSSFVFCSPDSWIVTSHTSHVSPTNTIYSRAF